MTENERAARQKKISHAIMWVVLLLLFFCFIFPFIMVVINVFKTKGDIVKDPLALIGAHGFTLDNFRTFWDSNHIMREQLRSVAGDEIAATVARGSVNVDTLVYSLWMAFLCTAICLLLGYPAAHIMADREFKLGPTLVILFVVPMWMNFLLRTIALMSIMEDGGLINNILEWVGIGKKKLLNNTAAVQVGMIYNFLPFMVFPIYNVLNKMDYKLSEAAMDLGCDKWHVF